MGRGFAGRSNFHLIDHGLARPIVFSEDGWRPGPAHHRFNTHDPAHYIFKYVAPARPGPARQNTWHWRRVPWHTALYGYIRHVRGSTRGFDVAGHGPAHVLSRTKNVKAHALTCVLCSKFVIRSFFQKHTSETSRFVRNLRSFFFCLCSVAYMYRA